MSISERLNHRRTSDRDYHVDHKAISGTLPVDLRLEKAEEVGLAPSRLDRAVIALENFDGRLRNGVHRDVPPKYTKAWVKFMRDRPNTPKEYKDPQVRFRRKLEKVLRAQLIGEARATVLKEFEGRKLSATDRAAYKAFILECEENCRIHEYAALVAVDEVGQALQRDRHVWFPVVYSCTISTLFAFAVCLLGFKMNATVCVGALLPSLAFMVFLAKRIRVRRDEQTEEWDVLFSIASNYRTLAEKARRIRLIEADVIETRAQLTTHVDSYLEEKCKVDARHCPSVEQLDQARFELQWQVSTDKCLRIASYAKIIEDVESEEESHGVRKHA